MLVKTIELVQEARHRGVAIGAFNTYNLELTRAIVETAEALSQPIILQLGVSAIKAGGEPLALATLAAARVARVPVAVHLDHCPNLSLIEQCFEWGFSSALADGSHLSYAENMAFTRQAVEVATRFGGTIEAELGYLAIGQRVFHCNRHLRCNLRQKVDILLREANCLQSRES